MVGSNSQEFHLMIFFSKIIFMQEQIYFCYRNAESALLIAFITTKKEKFHNLCLSGDMWVYRERVHCFCLKLTVQSSAMPADEKENFD